MELKSISKKSVSSNRWKIAQGSEKEYWDTYTKESLLKEEADRHKSKAKTLEKEWEKFIKIGENTKIIQIGCGPEDVINYFSKGKKFAIDPLADFYKKKFKINYDIEFIQARGEEIPYPDEFFDIVILANVLDHAEMPEKVMSEINRVLKYGGIFHFENLFYQKNFLRLAKIYGKLKESLKKEIFNIHHPFMFTLPDLKNIIHSQYRPLEETVGREIAYYENMEELKKIKLNDPSFTVKFPAIFGLYGTINYIAICKKKKF